MGVTSPPGSYRVQELGTLLFNAWRRGGAWDEARPDGEVLRATGEAREASAVGVVREMVLDALRELGDGNWAPWEAVAAYVRADSRTPGLARLLERWAARAGVEADDTRRGRTARRAREPARTRRRGSRRSGLRGAGHDPAHHSARARVPGRHAAEPPDGRQPFRRQPGAADRVPGARRQHRRARSARGDRAGHGPVRRIDHAADPVARAQRGARAGAHQDAAGSHRATARSHRAAAGAGERRDRTRRAGADAGLSLGGRSGSARDAPHAAADRRSVRGSVSRLRGCCSRRASTRTSWRVAVARSVWRSWSKARCTVLDSMAPPPRRSSSTKTEAVGSNGSRKPSGTRRRARRTGSTAAPKTRSGSDN